jgi:hypothetical protein
MIKVFDKTNVGDARDLINAKLAELECLGISVSLGQITYTDSTFTGKMKCNIVGQDDEYAVEFKRHGESVSFSDAVGKEIIFKNKKYIFRGFKPRARKSRGILECMSTGKLARISFTSINSQL